MASKIIVSPSPLTQLLQGSSFTNANAWETAAMSDSLATPNQRQTFNINAPLNTPSMRFDNILTVVQSPTTMSFPGLSLNKQKSTNEDIFELSSPAPAKPLTTPTLSTPTHIFREVVTLPKSENNKNNQQRFIARSEDVKTYKDYSMVTKTQIEVVPNPQPNKPNLPKLELPSPATVCSKMKLEYKPTVTVKLETPEQIAYDSADNNNNNPQLLKPTKKSKALKEKKFVCGFEKKGTNEKCTMRFYRQDELKRHERTHTGEKPFGCKYCELKFARSDHVRTHERIHTGERPYPCNFCDKAFARSDERLRHHKVHAKRQAKEEETRQYQLKRQRMNSGLPAITSAPPQNFSAPASVVSYQPAYHHPSPPPPAYSETHSQPSTIYAYPPQPQPQHHVVYQQFYVPEENLTQIGTVQNNGRYASSEGSEWTSHHEWTQ